MISTEDKRNISTLLRKLETVSATDVLITFIAGNTGMFHSCQRFLEKHAQGDSQIRAWLAAQCHNTRVTPHAFIEEIDRVLHIFQLNDTRRKRDYEVLGLKPDATVEEVKQAYRTLSIKYHPDKTGEDKSDAFIAVSKSYQSILNGVGRDSTEGGARNKGAHWRYQTERNVSRKNQKSLAVMAFCGVLVFLLCVVVVSRTYKKRVMVTNLRSVAMIPPATSRSDVGESTFSERLDLQHMAATPPLEIDEQIDPGVERVAIPLTTQADTREVESDIPELSAVKKRVNASNEAVDRESDVGHSGPPSHDSPGETGEQLKHQVASDTLATDDPAPQKETSVTETPVVEEAATPVVKAELQQERQEIQELEEKTIEREAPVTVAAPPEPPSPGETGEQLKHQVASDTHATDVPTPQKETSVTETPGVEEAATPVVNAELQQERQDIQELEENSLEKEPPSVEQHVQYEGRNYQQEIDTFLEEYTAAYEGKDLNRFLQFFEVDAEENGAMLNDVKASYEKLFAEAKNIQLSISVLNWVNKDDMVTLAGRFKISLVYSKWSSAKGSGQISFLLRGDNGPLSIKKLSYKFDK